MIKHNDNNRRAFLKKLSKLSLLTFAAQYASNTKSKTTGKVVVVGGGYGGATLAKYLKIWSPKIDVTLIEKEEKYVSCPMSNRVLSGTMSIKNLTFSYTNLKSKYGINVVFDEVTEVDSYAKKVTTSGGKTYYYDKLVVSPGIDFVNDDITKALGREENQKIFHAWKAGYQTESLKAQITKMSNGGVLAITVPKAPYRCPPGPYERVCQIAYYLKKEKPNSKILVFDANDDIQSKKSFFQKKWQKDYASIVEYVPSFELIDIDVKNNTLIFDFDEIKADVINVIPNQRAGNIANRSGLITANDRWCGVDFLTYESIVEKNVHIIGDSILSSPKMPKSGHMANQHAKVCSAAIIEILNGGRPSNNPIITNACYSYLDIKEVAHVTAVYKYDNDKKTMLKVPNAGGVSEEANAIEVDHAESWATNIWSDMFL